MPTYDKLNAYLYTLPLSKLPTRYCNKFGASMASFSPVKLLCGKFPSV